SRKEENFFQGLIKSLAFLSAPQLSRPGNRDSCRLFRFLPEKHHFQEHFRAKTARPRAEKNVEGWKNRKAIFQPQPHTVWVFPRGQWPRQLYNILSKKSIICSNFIKF
ncbi:MAG: hypothetical protein J6V48_10625, partial [Clostridia bacterium]|nr:hypothetical protein [Clostridia bacterium]